MKKWKSWLGVVLIVASAVGLIFWELQGREAFLMKPVLVAAQEIPAGGPVTAEAFAVIQVPEEGVVEGALSAEAAASLTGRCARGRISKNQQITAECFMPLAERLDKGESIFVLPKEWILMRSSALRKGDRILLYGGTSLNRVGEYSIAFVKDQTEQEVAEAQGGMRGNALDRTNGTAQISHLELVATLEEYEVIRQEAAKEGGLLVVQKPLVGGDGD